MDGGELDGQRGARWNATHMFIDKRRRRAPCRWDGDVLGPVPASESDKSGLTLLDMRKPPALSLPMSGDGGVLHVGEQRRLEFRLRRATTAVLVELGLPFSVRDLRIDAHDEASRLAMADLRAPSGGGTLSPRPQRRTRGVPANSIDPCGGAGEP